MKEESFVVNRNQTGVPFNRIFNRCVGAGRAKEGLRAEWQRQLRLVKEACGFQYLRFHGLFAEDMSVCQLEDGVLTYNWQEVDALFDAMLDIGIRPFVELSFMPEDMASGKETIFWWKGNVSPPKDFQWWHDLVGEAVNHWIERYGRHEVLKWYFEVWNEPNLPPFWSGSKSDYFKLYQVSVEAIKAIDQGLKVGGPATSNFVPDDRFDGEKEDRTKHLTHKVEDLNSLHWKGVWIEDFLAFCQRASLPVDFVSTHPYPTDFALDGTNKTAGRTRHKDSIMDDLKWLQTVIASSAYPEAEIHLTEWSSSPSPRDCSHDFLPAANYILRANIECHDLTDSLSYWVFTDIFEESGPGPRCFHGGFGMLTLQGIKKPSFHAYRFLNGLGEEALVKGHEYLITRNRHRLLQGLFYNYADELLETIPIAYYPDYEKAESYQKMGQPKKISGRIEGLEPGALFELEILDQDHGTAVTQWMAMGKPSSPTRQETQRLLEKSEDTLKHRIAADGKGILTVDLILEPWAIVFLREIGPPVL